MEEFKYLEFLFTSGVKNVVGDRRADWSSIQSDVASILVCSGHEGDGMSG